MRSVIINAVASRITVAFVALLAKSFAIDYDSSGGDTFYISSTSRLDSFVSSLLRVFVRWDALYFLKIAQREGYWFENEHAFFPGLPIVMSACGRLLHLVIPTLSFQTSALISGVVICNISFVLATVVLYKLTIGLTKNHDFALATAILYSWAPGGIFLSAVYSEAPFALLSFSGMLLFHKGSFLLASLLWGASSLFRANGIVHAGFFLYSLMHHQGRSFISVAKSLLCILAVISGFIAFQVYGYQEFCSGDNSQRRSWCSASLPLLYSWVQAYYWNNGLFKYWLPQNIPNFLLASPTLALSAWGVYSYASFDTRRFVSLGFVSKENLCESSRLPYMSDQLLAYMYLWTVLTILCVSSMHVQIVSRFFSSVPPLYWYAAHLTLYGGQRGDGKLASAGSAVVRYFVCYTLVVTVLFANFYPPA
ncbi:GPI mannosyltransferase 2 [Cladochytrium replicatum]|nr:GPI mannosyltransferase 2 [Cladochytrium replicatum]